MLAEPKLKILADFISQFNKEELIWVNGYLSGLVADPIKQSPVADNSTVPKKITIAYGTETGNSKKLATDFASKAKKSGIQTKLVSLDQYKLTELAKEEYFITVISTQGDGEPPVAAQKFYDHIHNNGFKLPQLKYGVLALGDTAYPMFCKTGEDVDIQLQHLGGQRIADLQKCDLDYESTAQQWFDNVIQQLQVAKNSKPVITASPVEAKKSAGKLYYDGLIQTHINLTAKGSSKKIYHIELAAEGVEFFPGDSIGIVPENDSLLVDQLLQLVSVDGNKTISWKNETASIRELLISKINISYLLEKSVKHYATISGHEIQAGKTDLLSLLQQYPLREPALFEQVIEGLTQIVPRIYNIASSPAAHNGEVHITVLRDVFKKDGQEKTGLCTQFLENKKEGDTVRFFIQTNKRFRLPTPEKEIIMIGPGTGIAPFRSFVAERDSTGAVGKNWLFFSEDQFTTDFLYQTEWQSWFETDTLTKISLSFNNGSEHTNSLADKIIQQGKELFEWLEQGAFLYLCGEKEPGGKAIEDALLKVFQTQTGNEAAANAYFENLKKENRYAKDLY
jgi:sulfite reductase (NADPH) flavoprotein alpha-component